MNKLVTLLTASVFALAAGSALAADTATKEAPKAATAPKTDKAEAKLVKPAGVTDEAWNKMSDADKKKAVEKAKADADKGDKAKTAAAPKKEKKGGC